MYCSCTGQMKWQYIRSCQMVSLGSTMNGASLSTALPPLVPRPAS